MQTVPESRGLPAGEDDHFAAKHFDEMSWLAALNDPHLRRFPVQLIVHLDD